MAFSSHLKIKMVRKFNTGLGRDPQLTERVNLYQRFGQIAFCHIIVRSEEAKSLQRPFAAGMPKALSGAGSAASEPPGKGYGVSLEGLR
ncbi:MAG: hypothetical protein P8Y45_16905, partial [Exilibacterium sp.]